MIQTLKLALLLFLTATPVISKLSAADLSWPLKGTIDISNGFGDYRDGRFHTGVDLRTGGQVGLPVHSPVDGYVRRLKVSYVGYGKGLYIQGTDGYLYVFGHLQSYAPAIDTVVKRAQYATERYFIDLTLPSDSLKVKKGALVAYSGETGAGAPHLHFEKRLTDENPLNPLSHGFKIADKVRPILERIGFQQLDDHSLFHNGRRSWYLRIRPGRGAGKYVADTVPFFSAPFGVLVDGHDRTRADGMQQAIPYLRLEIDGQAIYESRFDTLAFATGKSVYFEYDYDQAAQDNKSVRRLFHLAANQFSGSRGLNGSDGVVTPKRLRAGRHVANIVASDALGNTSEVAFSFLTGPPGPLMRPDSVRNWGTDSTRFYFTPAPALDSLDIDSTVVEYSVPKKWLTAAGLKPRRLENGSRVVSLGPQFNRNAVMRLTHHSREGGSITDEPFNGIGAQLAKKIDIESEIVEDGLIVTLTTPSPYGSLARIDLYGPQGLLGRVTPTRFLHVSAYPFFVRPEPEYARIDSIVAVMDTSYSAPHAAVKLGRIHAVGFAPLDTITVDSLFRVVVEKTDLFVPRFVELQKLQVTGRAKFSLVTEAYKVLPPQFPTQSGLTLLLTLNIPNSKNYLAGICRFDFEKERWTWLPGRQFDSNLLTADNPSGGTFAALRDLYPPVISGLTLKARQVISDPRPTISFTVIDTLSGIADDKSFDVRLDRKWMIPEFDPESSVCTFQPPELLHNGDHHLAIKVTDRAGNMTEQYLIFTVSSREGAKRK